VVGRALAGTQKNAAAQGQTIVWVDEAGFYLLPAKVRTYAPRGQTPILRVPLTRDHLSAISALTAQGRVLMRVQRSAYRSHAVVRFLKHLLQHIPGKLLVIWDGAPIHRSQVIKAFLASGAAARLQLERLPAYAPDLNPVELVWRYLKHVALRNVCCATLNELQYELRLALASVRHKREMLCSFPSHCGYHV
jgi:transposase